MSETAARQTLTRVGRPVDGRSVDAPGVPDWNYVDGWVELKYLPEWPAGAIVLPHRERVLKQALWLLRRHRAGGRANAILVVDREWLVLDAEMFLELAVRGSTREELVSRAVRRWCRLDEDEMLAWLKDGT
jgi:hypothetical protein